MRRSFRIQSTANPKSNLSSTMVLPRFSICQDWAAPLEITSSTSLASRPALSAKFRPSESPWTRPAMQIWLTILVSCPAPEGPSSVTALAKWAITGFARSKAVDSPPTITVSWPFSAPACPPDTGASRNSKPRFFASAASSRATFAEAVVWSTKIVPFPIFWKAPFGPSVTSRKSGSSPTQENTISAPSAALAGVSARRPLCFATQASALARLRLYTVTSCPPRATRCPAMGEPITPSPMNASLLTAPPLGVFLAKPARFADNYKVSTHRLEFFHVNEPGLDQRDSRVGHGCRAGGEFGPPRHAHGDGRDRAGSVGPAPASQPGQSKLGRPRPLRRLQRARFDAALRAPAPHRLRPADGGVEALSAAALEDGGSP